MCYFRKNIKHIRRWCKSYFCYRFLFPKDFGYRHAPEKVDVGWNVAWTYGVFRCPIDYLRVVVRTEKGEVLVAVEESPFYHFTRSFISGENIQAAEIMYRKYLDEFQPVKNSDDRFRKKQEMMKEIAFGSGLNSTFHVITRRPVKVDSGHYGVRIYDGSHRAVMAKVLGYQCLNCRLKM